MVGGWRTYTRVSAQPVPEGRVPVVLVHGMVVSGRYMVPTAQLLAPHHRVYIPDSPGFGESEGPERVPGVPDLASLLGEWMEAVGVGRAALLGNSFGCQVAAELAVRRPELVERLVLQGPTTDPRARTAARLITRWLLDVPKESPSQGPIMLRDYRQAGLRRAADVFRRMLEDRIEERLPRIEIPTLVVRGSRDPIVPQRWAEEATDLLPEGRLVVIPGAAHTINYSAPLELSRVVLPFLKEGR
ncbi:MAG: alpha/beta hydrolase [Actinomycetota bacterium]|nr:alpha/beta hydrolase [Actinomycetota bacterium]